MLPSKIHQDAIIIDPCMQYLTKRTGRSDKSGLTAAGLTVTRPGSTLHEALSDVTDFLKIIASEPAFCLAETPQSILDAKAQGKMAHIFMSQDSLIVGTNLDNTLLWKQLGLRVMQLTYNEQNLAGTGCLESHDGGLTQYGKILIREMAGVGITLDLTHVGEHTFMDAINVAQKPVIASHSNPSAVIPNPRNINDEQIQAIAGTGGVVCVTTWAPLIWDGTPGMPTLDDYLRCLSYVVELVGVDHTGISTDSMGTMGAYPRHDPNPDALPYGAVTDQFDQLAQPPDNNNRQPADFNGIEDYPFLTEKLVQFGFSVDEIGKLLGGNLLRVFVETW